MFRGKVLGSAGFWAAVMFAIGTAITLGDVKWALGATVLYFVSALLLFYGVIEAWVLPGSVQRRLQVFWKLRFGGYVPLNMAAALAYEEARAKKTIWATAPEKLAAEKSPDGILDWVGVYFGMHVPVWGVRPPSSRSRKSLNASRRNGHLTEGAKRLTFGNDANNAYVDLQIKAKDVRKVIKLMGAT
jgi:hypothetical protein